MIVRIVVAALLGVLTWTFLEYVIHRWLGHDKRFRRTPFAVEHIRHHAEGGYFAPTWKKLILAAIVTAVLCGPAILIAGVEIGVAYVLGLMSFYGVYEMFHRLEHISGGFGPYGRWARKHHFYHHFVDARFNHGVTTPIWDIVFGTLRSAETIRVPRRLCMTWLTDPATGEIRREHSATFTLATRPSDAETVS